MTAPIPLPLLVWLSPAFPVGGFAYSHGLESAVEWGEVSDAASAAGWLGDLVTLGSGRSDAVLLAVAYRAVVADDQGLLEQAAELALALQPGAERRLETAALGTAFVTAIRASWPTPALERLPPPGSGADVAYPIAVAVAAAGHGLGLRPTLEAYLLAFAAGLVSAGLRLGVLGQTEGQQILAGLLATVRTVAATAESAGLDDLGSCTLLSDIASLRHETQYSRLFRS